MQTVSLTLERQQEDDLRDLCRLIESAFLPVKESDHREQFLVKRLLASPSFIPELSLVARMNGELAGYILLTEIKIVGKDGEVPSLSLAPLAVHPKFQKRGVGSALIREAHRRAALLNYETILVLGHPDYYARFGYQKALNFGIAFPFEAPPECCMVKELVPSAALRSSGEAKFPSEFYDY